MTEKELYHFGIKGMRWGHRKPIIKKGRKKSNNLKIRNQYISSQLNGSRKTYKSLLKAKRNYYKNIKGYSDKKAIAAANIDNFLIYVGIPIASAAISTLVATKVTPKVSNKIYKNSLKRENISIDWDNLGPEIVRKKH